MTLVTGHNPKSHVRRIAIPIDAQRWSQPIYSFRDVIFRSWGSEILATIAKPSIVKAISPPQCGTSDTIDPLVNNNLYCSSKYNVPRTRDCDTTHLRNDRPHATHSIWPLQISYFATCDATQGRRVKQCSRNAYSGLFHALYRFGRSSHRWRCLQMRSKRTEREMSF